MTQSGSLRISAGFSALRLFPQPHLAKTGAEEAAQQAAAQGRQAPPKMLEGCWHRHKLYFPPCAGGICGCGDTTGTIIPAASHPNPQQVRAGAEFLLEGEEQAQLGKEGADVGGAGWGRVCGAGGLDQQQWGGEQRQ